MLSSPAGLLERLFARPEPVEFLSFLLVTVFEGLLDLVVVLSAGVGDLLAWRVGGFEGLLDLAFALSIGARDLLARRAGGLAGLLLRVRVAFTDVAVLSRVGGI